MKINLQKNLILPYFKLKIKILQIEVLIKAINK